MHYLPPKKRSSPKASSIPQKPKTQGVEVTVVPVPCPSNKTNVYICLVKEESTNDSQEGTNQTPRS